MSDPLSRPAFDTAMARAGIVLTEAEAEGIRAATAHAARFAAAVRVDRPVAHEPATTFAPQEPKR
ncbi:hypothetical protein [Plastoroseomonas hellenica]|uniref:Uncharacterized protein n=1 Tax=Plastoroseomonas hellenica TaxID=2687306 RepID=A0ABS5F8F0_9PROT|nr:hypothetical protein [Plastoroseomonas hellenica]MBR0647163.1 hypothetical protein [Plastoroseomonas hellenica]MBR0668829.1 hypothetical protein [Plastoroseomonas hellenica]